MSDPIFLNKVRISFPTLKAPAASYQNGPLKYRADFIMEPDSANWKAVQQEVFNLARAKWGDQAQQAIQMLERNKRSFGDGNERRKSGTMQVFDGYEGMKYVTATTDQKPQLYHPETGAIASNDMQYMQLASAIYGGCFVNAAIQFYIPKDPSKMGIFCGLIGVQFAEDGESFGGGAPDVSGMPWAKGAKPAGMPAPNVASSEPAMPEAMPFPDFMK